MMGIDEALGSAREAIELILRMTLPALLVSAAIGLAVTVFQAVTHINESSLQQNLKIFFTILILFATAPVLFVALRDYTMVVFERINELGTPP